MKTSNGYDVDDSVFEHGNMQAPEIELEKEDCYEGTNSLFFTADDLIAMLKVFDIHIKPVGDKNE